MSASQDDLDTLMSKMSSEELSAVAGKLRGKTPLAEFRDVFQAEVRRLAGAGQIRVGELNSLCW